MLNLFHLCLPSLIIRNYPTIFCNNCRGEIVGSINFDNNPENIEKYKREIERHIIEKYKNE